MAVHSNLKHGAADAGGEVKSGCPFSSKHGYSTRTTRQEYLEQHGLAEHDLPISLQADMDTTKPLYFWQIHSITGQEPLFDICSDFYDLIFADKEVPWFKEVFEKTAPQNHHIFTQAAFWIDALGGGRLYHGGNSRLNFHHQYNANSIMNAKGAKQWMHYMKKSLKKNAQQFENDPRILPCLLEFLKTKMQSYAAQHGWEFDASDFELSDILDTSATSARNIR